jgi:hypothetical protein
VNEFLKNLGSRKATFSKFHSEAQKALTATVKKSSRPGDLTVGLVQPFIFFLNIHKLNFFPSSETCIATQLAPLKIAGTNYCTVKIP